MKDIYDVLIRGTAIKIFPTIDWRIIKCQVNQESGFDPKAVSPCGARGLLQLMPSTAADLCVYDPDLLFIPQTNLDTGIQYLKDQFNHFQEIPNYDERIKFALASYNGGRGYINKALSIARKDIPNWMFWEPTSKYLSHQDCEVHGKHPDHKQITDYVRRIWDNYAVEKEKE